MIQILSIGISTTDIGQCRHADIIISDGDTAYLWAVGGLPVEGDLLTILEAREAELWLAAREASRVVLPQHQAVIDFRNLPGWASWTGQQAVDYINGQILSGMTPDQVEAWVRANVTSFDKAITGFILVGRELAELRAICEQMARAVMYLRNITVR